MKQLPWKWFDHRTDLPQWVKSRIGQIAIEWSVLERELEEMIHFLTDTDIGIARIVTNRMNARTRIDITGYLIEWYVYHSFLKPEFQTRFDKLGKKIATKTQLDRDMVAHGLWSKVEGKWHVLKIKGSRKTPELRPDIEKVSRPLLPQRQLITTDKLDDIIRTIVADANALHDLCQEMFGAISPTPLRYRPPKYTRHRGSRATKKVPSGQPQSSGGKP